MGQFLQVRVDVQVLQSAINVGCGAMRVQGKTCKGCTTASKHVTQELHSVLALLPWHTAFP